MPCILHPLLSGPILALSLEQDKGEPTSVTNEYLDGHVILELKAPMDISQISVTLSGRSISRLDGAGRSQSHQFFQATHQLLPRCPQLDAQAFKSSTMGPKQYAFPFSFPLFQDSKFDHMRFDEKFQTYKSDSKSNEPQPLRCQLPHSTGDATSNAEISYVLEARVTVGGIFKHVIQLKKSRQVHLYPLNSSHQPSRSMIQQREVAFKQLGNHEKLKTPYGVAIELIQGGHLALGQNVPIRVHVTQADPFSNDELILNDYQVMLVQKTVTRVGAQSQSQHLFRTLRTVSNLNLAICFPEMVNNTMSFADNSWGPLSLPTDITPTFETCNITRTYKLEVRLGFRGGSGKSQIRILEVQFPIEIMARDSREKNDSLGLHPQEKFFAEK